MNSVSEGLNRREFLSTAAATTAFAASGRRILGANDRIRLGVIGSGSRATALSRQLNQIGGIEWVAVSDAWKTRCLQWEEAVGTKVEQYPDYRSLLERADIDGVLIATFDHTHAQITVDACRAGKDVYLEKPMTSLPEQGLEVIKTVRETRRVVQVGMQQRSIPYFTEAKERFIDSGRLGAVHMVRTIWNRNTGYLVKVPPGMERKPDDLDWKACLAWLPTIPWDPKRYFNRFAYWDFSTGGMTGGLFVHLVDVVHWYLGLHRSDVATALGGLYYHRDGRDTPDNINVIVRYPEGVNITFEGSLTDNGGHETVDIVFNGTGGRLSIFRSGYTFTGPPENGKSEVIQKYGPYGDALEHLQEWLECMRTRRNPNTDVVEGHYSAMACHVANISYREGRTVAWDPAWDAEPLGGIRS